ncbi:MAG: adenosylcobinamide-GDP ribazoletransferase [Actinobacteria bacterium]|nr:adenosylcobinamide-GDP ribazoletransferase [Actinomycetota bacterium]
MAFLRRLAIALGFLTIVPIKIMPENERDQAKSMYFFTLIGILIGAFIALSYILLKFILPTFTLAALLIIIEIIITLGFHLDGLMDTFDGFRSGNSRDGILKIMKRSDVGAFGVIALVCLLILKYGLYLSIKKEIFWQSIMLAPAFGRTSMVLAAILGKKQLTKGSLARTFISHVGWGELTASIVLMATVLLLLIGPLSLALFSGLLSPVLMFLWSKRKIGGITGDILGAIGEISSVFFLMLIVIASNFIAFKGLLNL